MAQGRVKIGVGFDVDKSGLNELKASLANLQNATKLDAFDISTTNKKLAEIQHSANQVAAALNKSYNAKLGTYNIEAFKKEINATTGGLSALQQQWSKVATGERAFRNLANSLTSTNLELKETHSLLDSMGTTLMNTIKWSIASTAVNTVTGSIQKAWSFTKQLDESLTNIMIVTEKSSDQMAAFARQANTAAKALGASTRAYSDAALIYYQQGLGDDEVISRTNTTLKAANVTGQNAAQVSEQLTAVWNGYKVAAQETELYVDKLSAVAATTAADLEELSTGMSKVASAASTMGVDIDQLNAQLATVISVTRQAPESVGTAFKTIFARMGDIEAGLDTETTLGEYTSQMEAMGFHVLDTNNQLRDQGEVIEEIGAKWKSLSREQQIALAQTMAGTRQYNNLLALFDNWGMYEKALQTSANAAGTLNQQNEEYLDSLEAKMQQLTTTAEDLYLSLFDSDSFKDGIDLLTKGVDVLGQFVESVGGGGTLLLSLGTIMTRVFSKQVAQSISTTATNFINARSNAQALAQAMENIQEFSQLKGLNGATERIIKLKEQLILLKQAGLVTDEQFNDLNAQFEALIAAENNYSQLKERREKAEKRLDGNKQLRENEGKPGKVQKISFADLDEARKKAQNADANKVESATNAYAKKTQKFEAQLYTMEKEANATTAAVDDFLKAFNTTRAGGKTELALQTFIAKQQDLKHLQESLANSGVIHQGESVAGQQYEPAIAEAIYQSHRYAEALQAQANAEQALAEAKKNRDKVYSTKGNTQEAKNLADKAVTEAEDDVAKQQTLSNKEANTLEKRLHNLNLLNIQMKDLTKENMKELRQVFQEVLDGVEEDAEQTANKISGKTQKELNKIDLTYAIQKVTNFVSSLTSVISAIQIIQNLGSIWKNEDLTTGEKLLQTTMNLGSAIGMLAPAMISVTKAIKSSTKATKEDTAANVANAASQMAKYWWILLIVAALAALTAGTLASVNASKKEAEVLKETKERVGELQEAYNELASTYESLKSSIEDYTEAANALDKLAAGTTAWKDALLAANQQALELLDTYPDLVNYISRNADGLLVLSEEGKDYLQNQSYQNVVNAQRNLLIGQQAVTQADYAYQKEQLRRNMQGFDGVSVVEGILTAIVGSTTGLLDLRELIHKGHKDVDENLNNDGFYSQLAKGNNLFGVAATEEQVEAILQLDEDIIRETTAFTEELKKIGIENNAQEQALLQSVIDSTDAILKLKKSIDEATERQRDSNAQIYSSYAEKLGYSASDAAILGGMTANKDDIEEQNAQIDKLTEQYRRKYGNNKDLILRWAKTQNLDISASDISETGGANFVYTIDGKETPMSYDVLARELATAEVLASNVSNKDLQDTYEDLLKILKDATAESSDILKDILASNKELTAEGIENYNNETIQFLREKVENLSGAAQAALNTTIAKLEADIKAMATDEIWAQGTADTITSLLNHIGNFESLFDAGKYDAQIVRAIGAGVNQLSNFGGEKAQGAIQIIFSKSSVEDIQKFFSTINWGSETLIKDVANQFRALNVELDYTQGAGFELMWTLAKMRGEAVVSTEAWGAVLSTVKSINSLSDSLSAEKYEQLMQAYGAAIDSYFTKMEDGTYRLTKSVKGFEEAIDNLEEKKAQTALQEAFKEFTNYSTELEKVTEGLSKLKTEDIQKTIDINRDASLESVDRANALINKGSAATNLTLTRLDTIVDQGNVTGQEEAIALIHAYAQTEAGREALGLDPKTVENMRYWDMASWKDYIEWSGGKNVTIEGKGKFNYATIAKSLINSEEAYQQEQAEVITYYKKSDILNYIQQLGGINALTAQDVEDLKQLASDSDMLKKENNTAPILNEINKRVKKTQDPTQLKDLLTFNASLVDSEAELDAVFDSTGVNGEIIAALKAEGVDIADLKADAFDALQIKKQDRALLALEEEIKLLEEASDKRKQYNEFVRATREEMNFSSANATYLDDFNLANANIDKYQQKLEQLSELNPEQQRIKYNEILSKLQQEGINLLEARNAIEEHYLSYQESINESYDTYIGQIEEINGALEHQKSLVELIYGDKAIEQLDNYYSVSISNLEMITTAQKNRYVLDTEDYLNALKTNDESLIKATQEQYMQSADAYFKSLNDLAKMRQEEYLNSIDVLLKNFDEKLAGRAGAELEKMKTSADWVRSTEKDFLDPLERALAISNVERTYNEAIVSTTDLKAREELIELRDQELEQLNAISEMRDYDVERAEKELELLKAKIALERAEQDMSSMRLVRGANGDYSYQFVANRSAIEKAEGEYENALASLTQFDQAQVEADLDTYTNLIAEFKEKMRQMLADGATEEEIANVSAQYAERIKAIAEPAAQAMANLNASWESAQAAFGLSASLEDIAPIVSTELYSTMTQSIRNIDQLIQETVALLQSERESYEQSTSETETALDTALQAYLATFTSETGILTLQQAEIDKLTEMNTVMTDFVSNLSSLNTTVADVIAEIQAKLQMNYPQDDESTSTSYTSATRDHNIFFDPQHSSTFMATYDTGGYTGAWGPGGKILMAHEKELILNATDTENILNAVSVARALNHSMMTSIAGYEAMNNRVHLTPIGAGNGVIEQKVEIVAHFPDATDRDEIKAAFDDLIGLAVQHANQNVKGK